MRRRIVVTLTANPSVDRTIELDRLERGAVLRATGVRVEAGGKGVNVARALVANGAAARAVLPVGGAEGRQLIDLLTGQAGLEIVAVPIDRPVRANISVVEPDGTTTKLNEPGPVLGPAELDSLAGALVEAARDAGWAVLSGSLPPHAPHDWYARLVTRLHAGGTRVAVDTSGPALAAVLATGADLVKPNQEELAAAVGHPVIDLDDAVEAAAELQRRGAHLVLASLGADGAVLVDGHGSAGAVHAEAPVARPRSTVGAGDAALAGFLFAGFPGLPLLPGPPDTTRALAAAVAWGAAATSLPGSRPPGPADVGAITVHVHDAIDHRRPLLRGDIHAITHLG